MFVITLSFRSSQLIGAHYIITYDTLRLEIYIFMKIYGIKTYVLGITYVLNVFRLHSVKINSTNMLKGTHIIDYKAA